MKVRIDVEVRALRMDNQLSLSGREPWALLYTTHRDFPADFDAARDIPLEFLDVNVLDFGTPRDLSALGVTQAELDGLDSLLLPTARDIRLTIRGIADADPEYFAADANVGKPMQVKVRRESAVEAGLIAHATPGKTIRGLYLQPDPVPAFDGELRTLFFQRTTGDGPAIIQRLAEQLGADHKGLTLVGKRGERVVFGCSRRIRHTLSPDNSSLTFAAKEDLADHWLVALTLRLDRDWTWDALRHVSFEIFREKRFQSDAEADDDGGRPIGDWEVIPTASLQALTQSKRNHTTLIFLDAVEPKSSCPAAARRENEVPGRHRARLPRGAALPGRAGVAAARAAASRAAGDHAAGADPAHRLGGSRPVGIQAQRHLLGDRAAPPLPLAGARGAGARSERRLLHPAAGAPPRIRCSPTTAWRRSRPPEEPPLAIDPELVRTITPDQPDDEAGLAAMTRLIPSTKSDRHFLIPLPPGLHDDSPELFGLFTYELRVGHANIWSTAQGRFGRPLRSTGVQHPAPTLFCTCQRDETGLVVEAPFAEAVLNGKNITQDPPRTGLWALLYAQVRQADGKDWRNVLLDDRELALRRRLRGRVVDAAGKLLHAEAFQNVDAPARGTTRWTQDEIAILLRDLGLPPDAPLSVLCVEMMPTLEALRVHAAPGARDGRAHSDLVAAAYADRSGTGPRAAAPEDRPRPLSAGLGHHRILRTSPLTAVPEVCCPNC